MEAIKNFFADKRFGFYVTIAAVVLGIVTASVFASFYHDYPAYMSWPAFYLMLAGAAVSCILVLIKLDDYAPYAVALTNFIGLMLYIRHIYGYVAVVAIGIDITSVSAQFTVCTILFGLAFLVGLINIFLPQKKEVK